ncbi:MAG: apolipoprotein N-acyltransferase [Chloroflexus sp.]|nr:apolipoprotein N-acyltransferase [Chloroflexus sp.]
MGMRATGIHSRFSIALALSTMSGLLLGAAMPTVLDWGFLGWVGFIPLLLGLHTQPSRHYVLLALPCGIIWSAFTHLWYPALFGMVGGIFLILASGTFYAGLIHTGMTLQQRLPEPFRLLGLPVTWSALEFLRFVAPVVSEWWIEVLAKSQWRFPPALQLLTITGFPGLSFLIMLVNVALTMIILEWWQKRCWHLPALIGLLFALLVVGWGAFTIPNSAEPAFRIAGTVDLVNQDPAVQRLSNLPRDQEGYYADTPAMSQAIFRINETLTRSIADIQPAFVVWPENEFADADDPAVVAQLGRLARELNTYLVVDMVWHAEAGMHDAAVLIGPDGREVGRRAKINLTSGEQAFGFVAGSATFPVFPTPYGKVGLGVCWDRHPTWIVRELARHGAQIVLMPVDDDFAANPWFPRLHAADSVLRAVENRVTFATGATSGIAMVIDPYGRITAESAINQRSVVVGEAFTLSERTFYTYTGDWFGWVMCGSTLIGLLWRRQ